MTGSDTLLLGGAACGLATGAAAQFGRLCTFSAIEDAVVAGDLRRARAWALAVGVAIISTQALAAAGVVDLSDAAYAQTRIGLVGLIVGATLFGVGMALVGTCGFGILVRAGSGDLRALVAGAVLGITAFAATGGVLSAPRIWLANLGAVDMSAIGGATATAIASELLGPDKALLPAILVSALLMAFVITCHRIRRKLRMLSAAVILGLAVTAGWIVTAGLADPFAAQRPESLTFVGPLGRVILITMGETLQQSAFAVSSVLGVMAGSFAIAWARDELRWEAFDDQREMRRHLLGAMLMGAGGVLARGCTIGQGMSAASTLALTAPVAVLFMVLGARLGLFYLIEGRSLLAGWTRPSWSRGSKARAR